MALGPELRICDVLVATRFMEDRFGIPLSVFDDYSFHQESRKFISIMASDHAAPRRPAAQSTGIPFFRINLHYPKPTTAAVLLFGSFAIRNVVSLDFAQAEAFLLRRDMDLDSRQTDRCTGKGYVIARYEDVVLGLGFLRTDPTPIMLKSLFPGAWSAV